MWVLRPLPRGWSIYLLFDSKDDYRTGFRNVRHYQERSYLGLRSLGRSCSNIPPPYADMILEDVARETSPAAKSEEKRLFSQAIENATVFLNCAEKWA